MSNPCSEIQPLETEEKCCLSIRNIDGSWNYSWYNSSDTTFTDEKIFPKGNISVEPILVKLMKLKNDEWVNMCSNDILKLIELETLNDYVFPEDGSKYDADKCRKTIQNMRAFNKNINLICKIEHIKDWIRYTQEERRLVSETKSASK